MGLIFRPLYATGVNWGEPLTRGLVYANAGPTLGNAVNGLPATVSGAKTVIDRGLATGFYTTFGSATTDLIDAPLATHAAQRSYFVACRRNSLGGNSYGRIFSKNEIDVLMCEGAFPNDLSYIRTSGTSSQWKFTMPEAWASRFGTVVITLDDSASSPLAYGNGLPVEVTVSTAKSGSFTTNANNYTVGNRPAANRGFDGIIYVFAVWDRILSPLEAARLHAEPWAIFNSAVWLGEIESTEATTPAEDKPRPETYRYLHLLIR